MTHLVDILLAKENLVVLISLELSDKGPHELVVILTPRNIGELDLGDLGYSHKIGAK